MSDYKPKRRNPIVSLIKIVFISFIAIAMYVMIRVFYSVIVYELSHAYTADANFPLYIPHAYAADVDIRVLYMFSRYRYHSI